MNSHGDGDDTFKEVVALLDYRANHNKQHAVELADMGEKLRSLGKTEAADNPFRALRQWDFCRMSRDFATFCGKTPRGIVMTE